MKAILTDKITNKNNTEFVLTFNTGLDNYKNPAFQWYQNNNFSGICGRSEKDAKRTLEVLYPSHLYKIEYIK